MQKPRPQDTTTMMAAATFEALAVEQGLVTEGQVEECRALHRKLIDLELSSSIGEVFLKKGFLSPLQVLAIESILGHDTRPLIPGYEVQEKLGEGGMGAVYRARQISMDRLVAVKVLLPRFAGDEEGRERFVREARAVARLSHPNIVAGIDAGEAQGVCYFVMEYLEGESLEQTLRHRGCLPWREAAAIVRQVARALDHAHQHGIVHRDVKPGNIILLHDGTAKLADLGLARVAATGDAGLTQSGMIVGSPAYLSPEQARGDRELDVRGDIFSLGLTFFELVTGERAYGGDNPVSILSALLTRALPVEKLTNASLPQEAIAVIERMSQRELEMRYQTPALLLADLDRILAIPDSPRRRRRSVSAPVLWFAGLLLVAIAVWLAWLGGSWRGGAERPAASPLTAPPVSTVAAVQINLLQAIELATKVAPDAPIYHIEQEGGNFSADLANGTRTLNVIVSGADGRIVEQIEEVDDHSAEIAACKVPLARAVETALREVQGRAVDAAIELLPGRTVVIVKIVREDETVVEVEVDGLTGEVR
jgi:eukaryotic-like serine/threonine-protein kinase